MCRTTSETDLPWPCKNSTCRSFITMSSAFSRLTVIFWSSISGDKIIPKHGPLHGGHSRRYNAEFRWHVRGGKDDCCLAGLTLQAVLSSDAPSTDLEPRWRHLSRNSQTLPTTKQRLCRDLVPPFWNAGVLCKDCSTEVILAARFRLKDFVDPAILFASDDYVCIKKI